MEKLPFLPYTTKKIIRIIGTETVPMNSNIVTRKLMNVITVIAIN
jgi:hypothetical protein